MQKKKKFFFMSIKFFLNNKSFLEKSNLILNVQQKGF